MLCVIGGRGSGKTSVLLSLGEIISASDKRTDIYQSLQSIYVIKPLIEPRFFSSQNGILQLVISRLFSLFKSLVNDESDQAKTSEIIQLFEETSKAIGFENEANRFPEAIESLDSYSHFFDIKKSLKKLVDAILACQNKKSDKRQYSSMLFMIDDLDLDSSCAYKTISQITKFLKIPNLIFYLSFDIPTIDNVLQRGQIKELFGLDGIVNASSSGVLLNKRQMDLLTSSKSSYFEKLAPERFRCYIVGSPKYSEFYQFIIGVVDHSNENVQLNIENRWYDSFINTIIHSGSIRHVNQCLNLIAGDMAAETPLPYNAAFSDVLEALFRLAYPDEDPKNQASFEVVRRYSELIVTPVEGEETSNIQALFKQACLSKQYWESESRKEPFSTFFFHCGLSGDGHDDEIARFAGKIARFQDLFGIEALRPVEFFELFSQIAFAKTSTNEPAKKVLKAIDLYLPGSLTQNGDFPTLNSVEISDKTINLVSLSEDANNPLSQLTNLIHKQRIPSKATIDSISALLSEAIHMGQLDPKSPDIRNLQDQLARLYQLRMADPLYKELRNSVMNALRRIL